MRWQRLAVMAFACAAFLLAATPCPAGPPVTFELYGSGIANSSQPDPTELVFNQTLTMEDITSPLGLFPLGPLAKIESGHILTFTPPWKPFQVGAHGTLSSGWVIYEMADGSTLPGTYSGSFVRIPDPAATPGSLGIVVLTLDITFGPGIGKLKGLIPEGVHWDETSRLKGVTGTAHTVGLSAGLGNPYFTYTTVGTLSLHHRHQE
jgi:hypothetical protein